MQTCSRRYSDKINLRALCEQYEFDEKITKLLNKCEIHLLPSLNPDGFCLKTRTNANNQDLNRCFPDWSSLGEVKIVLIVLRNLYFIGEKERILFTLSYFSFLVQNVEDRLRNREPEVEAVMRHLENNNFVLSIDYHDGYVNVI